MRPVTGKLILTEPPSIGASTATWQDFLAAMLRRRRRSRQLNEKDPFVGSHIEEAREMIALHRKLGLD